MGKFYETETKTRVSQKYVYAFGGMWNKNHVLDIQNCNVNLSRKD